MALVGLGLVLAVGPVLYVRGGVVTEWTPGRIMAQLPIVGMMRLSHRWMLLSTLGLAVLAARGARPMPVLAAVLIVAESVWFSAGEHPTTHVTPPAVVHSLSGPVLDLPARTMSEDARGRYLVWQRTHGFAVPYALSMRAWSDALASEPLVAAVASMDKSDPIPLRVVDAERFRQAAFAATVAQWRDGGMDEQSMAGARSRLVGLGFSHVVLHQDLLTVWDARLIAEMLGNVLGEPDAEMDDALRWDL